MTAALENTKHIDIVEWLTLNTAASPTKIKIGETPNAKNVWVDEKPGSVITAPGIIKVGTIPSNNPVTFCINFFKTSAGTQTFVVSDNSTVWTTTDFQNFTSIITGLSSAFQLRGAVIRDKLWLTNGSDAVRNYDGTTVTLLDGSASTPNVPKGKYIAYYDERVWIGHIANARSKVFFTALTDSSGTIIDPDNASAWPSSNNLQVSEGDADFLTGLLLYRGYLHFFKQYSIWRIGGYDEYTYTRIKTRASTGTRFNESIQVLDNLIHLIGVDGIYMFDGEEAVRISDIIDPATASQTAFGFNQLQQPNANTRFWEITDSADWNLGTVPVNLGVSNAINFQAFDSLTTFNLGTLTNLVIHDADLNLDVQASGGSSTRLNASAVAYLDDSNNGATIYGQTSYMTDGDTTRECGFGVNRASSNAFVSDVNLGQTAQNIGRIKIDGIQGDTLLAATIQVNTGGYQTKYGNQGTWSTVGSFNFADNGAWTPKTVTVDFAIKDAIQVRILFSASGGSYQVSEISVYAPAYQATGKFVSRTLDYGAVPNSFGNFNADSNVAGQTLTFFTQSSSDGISWEAEMSVSNGGAIASTVNRYLRWGANFTSDGTTTPSISYAYLMALYFSAIHDTGGSIFAWGPFEAQDASYVAQTINFYYRTATTSAGIPGTAWSLIVPGGVISSSTLNQFVQFKIEILGGDTSHLPSIPTVIVNWVIGNANQVSTLQNVASAYWRNRYWLSAAGPGASSNDTVLVRGKKTFGSPWQLKDFHLLSFTRFQDSLYAGSSTDGSIYQVDTGYSEAGAAIDSYFETGDFTFGGFSINPTEILIEVERTGSYNLTVGVSLDQGANWTDYSVDLTQSTYANNYWKRINIDTFNTDRIRLRVRTNGIDQPFQVHNLFLFYTIETARGSIK